MDLVTIYLSQIKLIFKAGFKKYSSAVTPPVFVLTVLLTQNILLNQSEEKFIEFPKLFRK